MPTFPERLTAGDTQHSVTYTLAAGHYLIRARDAESFSAVEHFAPRGLMAEKLPGYIEAARKTLEPAGLRWIELLSDFTTSDAEAEFAADTDVEDVLPVYFAQGGGVESAATPLHDTINVELDDNTPAVFATIEALGLSHDTNASELLAPVHVFHVNNEMSLAEATGLLAHISALPGVLSVEFDWLKLETYAAVPNDPNFSQQWGLNAINLANALDLATGSSNVWIAIIDSGFDLGHPDINFTPNTAANPTHFNAVQALAGNQPPYNAGSAGVFHGTAVAGIAAARTNNALGVAGVGGGCQVMPVSLGTVPSANRVAAGVNWAANNGARVASMSLGTSATNVANNAMNNAWAAGLVICAATGNFGGNTTSPPVNFPANHQNVIAVGASDQNGQRKRPASADGEGWGSQFDNNTDVVAPGVRIWTTDEQAASGYNSNNGGPITVAGVNYPSSGDAAGNYFSVFNGTSSATPHVAGLAGLLFSAGSTVTNTQVRNLIESTCTKTNPGLYPYTTVAGRPNGTWHQEVGYGQINTQAALQALLGVPNREIAFREGWISFPQTVGIRQRKSATINFGRRIVTHQAMLKGFNISYSNGDHHILENEIDLDSSVSGTTVTVTGDFLLRDSSGNIDDPYRGWINFVVAAELE
ncbi:MAG: S8 family serine peptidase [Gammaproteobacteria bacterium]|nr:S8 family serine peptidase [Gammaproteobacteria bacterium]